MSLLKKLKQRNMFRVAIAYLAGAWLLIEVSETLFPIFSLPESGIRLIVILAAIGFPLAMTFSWIFEITPEGVQLEKHLEQSGGRRKARRKLDRVIIVLLSLALGYFAIDEFVIDRPGGTDRGASTTQQAQTPSGARKSIAVLPFVTRSQNPEDRYFTDGMHDELLTRLHQISAITVISRTSVLRYRETTLAIPEIAAELGVATILEGGVQRIGDQVRVNVQLIDASTDDHLWADIFDHELTAGNLFSIQSDITRAIAQALHAELTQEEDRVLADVPTRNLAAYEAFVRGRGLLDSASRRELEAALEHFSEASTLDPEFAGAWAGICEAHLGLYARDSDRTHVDAAEQACNRGLSIDDSRIDVLVAIAALYRIKGSYARAEVSLQQAHFNRAEQTLEAALKKDGEYVDAIVELGRLYASQNRKEEAEETLLRAVELAPNSWLAHTALTNFYYRTSDAPDHYERADYHALKAAAIRPDMAASWNNVGVNKYMMMQYEEAVEAWKHSLAIEPNRTGYTNTGLALDEIGRFEEAAEMQRKAAELAPDDYRVWGRLGDSLAAGGAPEEEVRAAYGEAARLARKSLEVNDRNWRTYGFLAWSLVQAGDFEGSALAVQRALELSDRHAEALMYAANCALAEGDVAAYLDLAEEMVAKDPSFRMFINKTDERLAGLPRYQALIADQP